MNPLPAPAPNDLLRQHLAAAVSIAGLSNVERDPGLGGAARKRARLDPRAGSHLASVMLVQEDDVLRWVYEPPPASSRRRGRRASLIVADQDVVQGFQFLEVPPNQIVGQLESLDSSLTPQRGLRQWVKGVAGPVRKNALDGRVLLLVHGTFSRGDMFFEECSTTPEGRAFLARCEQEYSSVLTFDHPTLAVSPWLNALDLSRAMAGCKGPVDVICHSRGGLVTAWWLLHARPAVERVVFVGSPLEGTSLAAPYRLKQALDLLGNLARAVGTMTSAAATAVPMLAVAGGIMKIVGGTLLFSASSPLIDAGVAIIPGLAAQSRVANNGELLRLLEDDWMRRYQLHAIHSNFEPSGTPEPWWKFWRHFRNLTTRTADWGADAVFEGPNDLVVDTASMTQLGRVSVAKGRQLAFDGADAVHHCSYFRQPRTFRFLDNVLKL